VYNGLRHYRVRVVKPITSFLCFGKYHFFLNHDGQRLTCQRCNLPGHFPVTENNRSCGIRERIKIMAGLEEVHDYLFYLLAFILLLLLLIADLSLFLIPKA